MTGDSPAGHARTECPRPNLVFILADDLGWVDTGAYGSDYLRTPNIDRLARGGLRFTEAYAASPLCSPTRSSILTGLVPARTGITAPKCHVPHVVLEKRHVAAGPGKRVLGAESVTRLSVDYRTLPQAMREAGYRNGHFGKWHLGAEPYSPLEHGFDVDVPHSAAPAPGGAGGYFAPWAVWRGRGQDGEHLEDRMSTEAVGFLRENRHRAFFLNYWSFSVHAPWMGKAGYVDEAEQRVRPECPQRNPIYAAMVRSLDDAVGRLLDAIEELGLVERTIVVFTSDNGGWYLPARERGDSPVPFTGVPVTSNQPLRSGKGSIYEGGIRVPLVVSWPGRIEPGTVTDAMFQSVDFFPTFHELLALPGVPGQVLDGVSQASALLDRRSCRDRLFVHLPHGGAPEIDGFSPSAAVRRGPWKLIRFFAATVDGRDRHELYNLGADIGERHDLAEDMPALVDELGGLLSEFLRDCGAVIPILNPSWGETGHEPPGDADRSVDSSGYRRAGRRCVDIREGGVRITRRGQYPGIAFVPPGRILGPAILRLRMRGSTGCIVRVQASSQSGAWTGTCSVGPRAGRPAVSRAASWEAVAVLALRGPIVAVRVIFPDARRRDCIDRIELSGARSACRWVFESSAEPIIGRRVPRKTGRFADRRLD